MASDSIPDFKPPSKLPVVIGVVVGLIVGAGIGVLVMSQRAAATARAERKAKSAESARVAAEAASAEAVASASAAIAAKNAPAPPLPLPPPTSVAGRAMTGDEAARKEIEARPVGERTADEAAALSRARVEAKKKELAELARKITLLPKLAKADKEVSARLKELSSDREIATDTLRMFASLPGITGPDLLYAAVVAGKKGEVTDLADQLLRQGRPPQGLPRALGPARPAQGGAVRRRQEGPPRGRQERGPARDRPAHALREQAGLWREEERRLLGLPARRGPVEGRAEGRAKAPGPARSPGKQGFPASRRLDRARTGL